LKTGVAKILGEIERMGKMSLENQGFEAEGSVVEEVSGIPVKDEQIPAASTFEEAGVSEDVAAAVKKIGWAAPTPVQGMCLPLTTKGRDVAGFAQTGTGKTGVFVITVAERLHGKPAPERSRKDVAIPEVVVLTPTRELAMQIDDDAQKVIAPLGIRSVPVFGGVDLEKQAASFKDAPRMIVATPGRLKDFYQRKIVDLSQVKIFICDEADRMFDMGFIDDVEYFLDKIPEDAQKLLFSATTNDNVKELAFEYLNQPAYISVNPEVLTPELIDQHAVICDTSNKLRVMLGLIREHNPVCAIIFTNTKMTAEWLHFKLAGNGIDVDLITGDLPQKKRIQLIHRIKEGKVKALIATDVASRGLHISKVSHVYNFDVPDDPANYVHRIGRTARAGAKGSSYTLVCEDYGENIRAIQEMLGSKIELKGEWFNSDYLKISDLAGNPYVVGGPLYRDPKDRFDRKSANGRGDDRGGRSKFPDRDRPERDTKAFAAKVPEVKGQFPSPEHHKSHRQRDGRNQHQGKDFQSKTRTLAPQRHGGTSHGQDNRPVVYRAEGTPIGIVGWVVKIFKGLFGMK
jgi:ATP-dependent RNA helicase RhlB